MSNLDPVTLTVIQNGLIQVCNEMDLAFVRAAFSPVISEGMDRSDGIYDATDGALIAQGELGLPVFVGTMQFSTRAVIERVKSHYEVTGAPDANGNVPIADVSDFDFTQSSIGPSYSYDSRDTTRPPSSTTLAA